MLIVVGILGIGAKGLKKKKNGGIMNQTKDQDHSDHRIVKTVYNTEKGARDLGVCAFSQTPVKDYQPKLV